MKSENILKPVQNYIVELENDLKNVVEQNKNELCDDVLGFLFSKSKRLRPAFVFLLALLLDKISANLNFDDNKISIKDTFAYLNGSRFAVLGDIYDDSSLSVNIKSDPLKISDIVNLLVQLKALKSSDIKDFAFNGGNLTISIDAKGKLQNILPKADIQLNNL